MNIVQLHNKTKFFLDAERSPRFKLSQVDKALNTATMDLILDRYDNIRTSNKEKAFQTSQRLRDELYTLVKVKNALTATGDLVPVSQFPTDYMLCLILIAYISGLEIATIPLTYDEMNMVKLDPFRRPSITWPERIYRIESSSGIKVIWGDVGKLTKADMYYIKKPAKVSIGTEISIVGTTIAKHTTVIAYVPTVLTLYNNGVASTKSLAEEETYQIGSDYAKLTSGIVFKDYTSSDVPEQLHEEICRKAAAILSGNVENYNRSKDLEDDIVKPA